MVESVTLLVWATFFAPVPQAWMGILLFGIGIWIHTVYHWFKVLKSRNLLCRSFLLTLRTCTLLVLLSSWVWSEVTVPKLVETDLLLQNMYSSIPENLMVTFNTTSSTISYAPFEGNESVISNEELAQIQPSPIEVEVPLRLLEAYRLEMPQTPMVDWLQSLHTMGGFYEVWYRLFFGPWIPSMRGLQDVSKPVIEITEFRVGDRVLSGGRRYGQARKNGTVARVYPSPYLEKFLYEVDWDGEDASGNRTTETAYELVPAESKIYLFSDVEGRIPIHELPRNALAVFTKTNMSVLEGYSMYYSQFWRIQHNRPSDILEIQRNQSQSREKKLLELEGTCLLPREAPAWTEISISQLSRWKPLAALSAMACRKDGAIWMCSKEIARNNFKDIHSYFYPFVEYDVDKPTHLEKNSRSLFKYYAWWILFFVCQTFVLLIMSLLAIDLALVPLTYVFVNSFRHVEELGNSLHTVVHVSLRTYDSLSFSYHFVVALKQSGFKFIPDFYFQHAKLVILAHVAVNCGILLFLRAKNEVAYDDERNALLATRRRRLRLPGRRRDAFEEEQPFCRICFDNSPPLVAPCLCDGSMRYVHVQCLTEWRFRSVHTESFVRCDQCHYRYKIRTTWWGMVFRSSLFISLASIVVMVGLYAAGAFCFKLLDALFIGRRLSDWVLGAKISYYVRERSWADGIPPANPTEQLFVESFSRILDNFYLELGHVISSVIMWGYIAFLTNEHFTMPWIWIVNEDMVHDEGWLLYLGGKTAIVGCVGQYRLFCDIWNRLKLRTGDWLMDRETTLVSVDSAFDDVKPGTLLKTPYGLVRMIRYRTQDDVVESEFVTWKGRQGKRFMMFRDGAQCLATDKKVDSMDEKEE